MTGENLTGEPVLFSDRIGCGIAECDDGERRIVLAFQAEASTLLFSVGRETALKVAGDLKKFAAELDPQRN